MLVAATVGHPFAGLPWPCFICTKPLSTKMEIKFLLTAIIFTFLTTLGQVSACGIQDPFVFVKNEQDVDPDKKCQYIQDPELYHLIHKKGISPKFVKSNIIFRKNCQSCKESRNHKLN